MSASEGVEFGFGVDFSEVSLIKAMLSEMLAFSAHGTRGVGAEVELIRERVYPTRVPT